MYYNNEKLNFYRLNIRSGKKEKIISLSGIDDIKEFNQNKEYYANIDYCKDYIVIDLNYSSGKVLDTMKRRLLIFNYNGRLIKNKKMAALL